MNAALMHRGPDTAGTFTNDDVSLGHVLLSIRENKVAGKQPFLKDGSPWVLLFNGQLYNTKQLHTLLGLTETIDLDTELLFRTIQKFGWDFISHIHGMFAIALYNTEEKCVRLYRGPSGQKNIYYYHSGDTFIFSSEIKGILASSIDRTPDTMGVTLATLFGYIPNERTLFAHIKKTLPSEVVTYSLTSNTVTRERFRSTAAAYYPHNTTDAFQLLISEHLQSKEPVAINLSGGLDSSLIAYEMTQANFPIYSYTNVFIDGDEKYNTDAVLAKRLANDLGSAHTEIPITKDVYFDNFIESYRTIEEPNYNISLPNYLATAKAEGIHGDGNRVILSGDGGDELFGGYPSYQKNLPIDRMLRLLTRPLFNFIKNKRNGTHLDFGDYTERWIFFKQFYAHFLTHTPNPQEIVAEIASCVNSFIHTYTEGTSSIQAHMFRDRLLWLANESFIRSDKLYMHESLELRSPLSYHPFRQYIDAQLTDSNYAHHNGFNKPFLRNHYTNKLPDYITTRKDKSGWRAPISNWYDNRFKNLFLEILGPMQTHKTLIDWGRLYQQVKERDTWPGKYIHLYLSLAILAQEYNLEI